MAPPKVTPQELKTLAAYVFDLCGIVLDETKAYLLESRLGPLTEEFSCATYLDLYQKSKTDAIVETKLIDAISTHETSFFRDGSPFRLFEYKILPDIVDRLNGTASKSINIWSAACSTGQEVYSITMVLKDLLPDLPKWRIRILGTDISDAAVTQASYGQFTPIEIGRGLPNEKLSQYFNQEGKLWKIKDELRAMAYFQRLNLMESFTSLGKFDVIFCRNVAIYFDIESRKDLFNRLADQLKPECALVIGSTESLIGITDRFERKEYQNAVFYALKT